MNASQERAIAQANAFLTDAALPSYDELVATLEKSIAALSAKHVMHGLTALEMDTLRTTVYRAKQVSFMVMDKQGRFYTRAGYEKWSADESIAQRFVNSLDARTIARLEGAEMVPAA